MQSRRAKKSGKKSCRYSFLMIRFAISLKLKFGKERYDFISKCFNLPSGPHLGKYKSPSVGAPDGILYDTLNAERSLFDTLNDMLPEDSWKRHGSLTWDSMVIKEKLHFCPNTMRIVGYADDAFDLNVIMSELKDRMKNLEDTDNPSKDVPKAKHFLVFIFTTWEKNMKRHQMVVSRYGVLSLDASYIIDKVNSAIVALSKFGWIVDNVGGDGASENRSALKQMGTITAREILSDVITELYGDVEVLEKVPIDFTVAFRHPVHDDVIVFISADMPHLIKKIVNSFDRSSKPKKKTELSFRNKSIALGIIQKMWETSSDGDGSSSINIFRKFSRDHFEKNAFNQMCVYLAAQITSMTTVELLGNEELLSKCKYTKEEVAPMVKIISKLDQMIDIMNAKSMHRNKKRMEK